MARSCTQPTPTRPEGIQPMNEPTADTTTDDSWRARARDRMRPMKARALAELLMKTPDAVVLVDTVTPDCAVFPLDGGEGLAAATGVTLLESGELVIRSDEGD